jgi:hypothetical protein
MNDVLLPTSLVGSYAQPDWLIDRKKLAGRFPPRVRAWELWRVAPEFLEEAQDDATLLAIRDQERAGLDIITDGEQRRESYSNRFATALEGVDIDNPGTALDRSGHPNPVPRIVGKIRRKQPVAVGDVKFLRANTNRAIKITVPGPFTMSQQAQYDFYKDEQEMVLDYAAAVNAEIKDLFAAGADIVQIDEPYTGCGPRGCRRDDRDPHLLRLCRYHPRATIGLFIPAGIGCLARTADFDRDRAIQSRLLGAAKAARQIDHTRHTRPVRHGNRNPGNRCGAHSPCPAPCTGRTHRGGARLWAEISPPGHCLRQNASDG